VHLVVAAGPGHPFLTCVAQTFVSSAFVPCGPSFVHVGLEADLGCSRVLQGSVVRGRDREGVAVA